MYKRRMKDHQVLYPEPLYQLVRTLHELWDSSVFPEKPDKALKPDVFISFFSKHSRAFHWASVGSNRWEFGPNLKVSEIKQAMKDHKWDEYAETMSSLNLPVIDSALQSLKNPGPKTEFEPRAYHHALLRLFQSYPINPSLFFDGIVYRNLEALHKKEKDQACRISSASGVLQWPADDPKQEQYAWAQITMKDGRKNLDVPPFQCQTANKPTTSKNKLTTVPLVKQKGWQFQDALLAQLFLSEIRGAGGKIKPTQFLLIPFYDAYLDQSWGCLWGNLILLFDKAKYRNAFKTRKLPEVLRGSRQLSAALDRSALSTISTQPIWDKVSHQSYDLVEHFVREIIWLQDWERIIVYQKKGGTTYEPQYCYQRVPPTEDDIRTKWKRCRHEIGPSCGNLQWNRLPHRKTYLRWEQDLWDEAFLPDLSDEERSMYGGIHLAFKYPVTAVIPSDPQLRKALGAHYIRQQIEVLRELASKIRTRRSALRTAAVTIMSRNMSHNIGSHVLSNIHSAMPSVSLNEKECAAYDTVPKLDKGIQEHLRTGCAPLLQFSQYLQERMDFLADVATSSPLAALSLDIQKDVIKPFEEETVLLERITGTGKLAKVSQNPVPNYRVASPGGRLGAHAFYVLLENVIRNTAKHSSNANTNVEVWIAIRENEKFDDLYEVIVWDKCANGQEQRQRNGQPVPLYEDIDNAIKKIPLITESGEVNDKHWGLREMTIAAAYLRKIKLEDMEQEFKPPLLEAVSVDDNGKKSAEDRNLGYRFYLLRAKDLVVVSEEPIAVLDSVKKNLRQKGIDLVFGKEASEQALSRGLEHEMMLWLTPDRGKYDQHRAGFPVRLFVPENGTGSIAGAVPVDASLLTDLSDPSKTVQVLGTLWEKQQSAQFPDARLYRTVGTVDEEANGKAARENDPAVDESAGNPSGANGIGQCILVNKDGIITPPWSQLPPHCVIYDHHGALHRKKNGSVSQCLVHRACDDTLEAPVLARQVRFWEPFQGAEPVCAVVERPPADSIMRKIVAAQLVEAGCTTIAIVDERVQRASEEIRLQYGHTGDESEFLLRDLLAGMGVYIPSKSKSSGLDLEKAPDLQALERWLKAKKTACSKIDFLVIHQGILDRLFGACSRKSESMANWLDRDRIDREYGIKEVVVCSGRGRPSDLPDDVRFVPLSSMLRWTVQGKRKSKYHLCQLLYGSRRVSR